MQFARGKSVLIGGRAGQDAKLKQTSKGSVCEIGLNISEPEEDAKWVNVVGWGSSADLMQYLHKGDYVVAAGYVKTDSYVDKEGMPHTQKKLVANIVLSNALLAAPKPKDDAPALGDTLESLADDDAVLPF